MTPPRFAAGRTTTERTQSCAPRNFRRRRRRPEKRSAAKPGRGAPRTRGALRDLRRADLFFWHVESICLQFENHWSSEPSNLILAAFSEFELRRPTLEMAYKRSDGGLGQAGVRSPVICIPDWVRVAERITRRRRSGAPEREPQRLAAGTEPQRVGAPAFSNGAAQL